MSEQAISTPQITEPATMITDYMIALEGIILGILMLSGNLPSKLMGVSFLITAIGAIGGGTSHGFVQFLPKRFERYLWKLTTNTIGIAAFFFFLATAYSTSVNTTFWLIISSIALVVYLVWMYSHDAFTFVIAFYVPLMLISLIFKIIALPQDPSAILMIIGILIAFLAAGIQVSNIKIHKHFNHNDLFHVVQMVSLYIVFLASKQFIVY